MSSPSIASAARPRRLLADPHFARLWFAGAVGNAMRWFELLIAGVFTYDATHSALLVALITAARSLPMFFLGPFAGVIGEALNRRRLLIAQQSVLLATSASLGLLSLTGQIRVWHLAVGGAVAGVAWAAEMAVRRRMIGEVVKPDRVGAAVALDSLTNSIARVVGPLCGGTLFETIGLGGAYLLSAGLYLAVLLSLRGLAAQQEPGRLYFSHLVADLTEGVSVARRTPAILTVVLVTIIMNSFGFCYSALIPPLGLAYYHVSPALVGLLAAAEPTGAILVGTALSIGWLRLETSRALVYGSFLFFGGVIAMAFSPWYGLAFLLLLIGGLGTATFSNMQTSLVLLGAPARARSRVMGLVTMCIGTGPLGVLAIGALSERLDPPRAILIMAGIGVTGLVLVWRRTAARN